MYNCFICITVLLCIFLNSAIMLSYTVTSTILFSSFEPQSIKHNITSARLKFSTFLPLHILIVLNTARNDYNNNSSNSNDDGDDDDDDDDDDILCNTYSNYHCIIYNSCC